MTERLVAVTRKTGGGGEDEIGQLAVCLLPEVDVNGEMRLDFGLRTEGEWKCGTDQKRQEQTAEASQETGSSVSESDQAGKLVPSAAIEWEPVDFASAAIAGDHDGPHARERAQTFGAVIAAVAA